MFEFRLVGTSRRIHCAPKQHMPKARGGLGKFWYFCAKSTYENVLNTNFISTFTVKVEQKLLGVPLLWADVVYRHNGFDDSPVTLAQTCLTPKIVP